MKKPEILAPAGSFESLKAAVMAGCDAIYIGGTSFGARAYANNLSEEEMIAAIQYCHLHHVKIYITVNTLLKENEREEKLYNYFKPFYEAGVDAAIVQDFGVLKMFSECFPEMEIHASTQMALTMGKKLDFLKSRNVSRIVPARELSIGELEQMRKDTDLEMEVFVHGALCYCYSGQCLFSSMFGGRSGNRGRCAQPCRLQYKVNGEKSKLGDYPISLKELCDLKYIDKLIESGVDSFKIEGRMKRPEYTAFVVSVYRKYVDLYFSLGKEKYREYLKKNTSEFEDDIRKLMELYNRKGFTQGYLEGQTKNACMLSSVRPKHGGVLVGKVLEVYKREVKYKAFLDISPQDVVEFRDDRGNQIYEYTLGQKVKKDSCVMARYQKGCNIKKGDLVYRTKNAPLLEKIRQDYLERDKKEKVTGYFTAKIGEKISFTVVLGDISATETTVICEEANNRATTKDMAIKSLNQTGNSPFDFETLYLEMDDNVFLPVGVLKKIRRDVLEKLQEKINEAHVRKSIEYVKKKRSCRGENSKEIKTTAAIMNLSQLENIINFDLSRIYVYTEEMTEDEIIAGFKIIKNAGKEAMLVFPRIFRLETWKRFEKSSCDKESFLNLNWDGYLVKNHESINFIKSVMKKENANIVSDYHLYVMNEGSIDLFCEEGVKNYTLPLELSCDELKKLAFTSECELVVYGKLPLMISAQCVKGNFFGCNNSDKKSITTLEDYKGRKFECKNYCKYCYNVIYQSQPYYLMNENLSDIDVKSKRYDFTTETGRECADILRGNITVKTNTGHFYMGIE